MTLNYPQEVPHHKFLAALNIGVGPRVGKTFCQNRFCLGFLSYLMSSVASKFPVHCGSYFSLKNRQDVAQPGLAWHSGNPSPLSFLPRPEQHHHHDRISLFPTTTATKMLIPTCAPDEFLCEAHLEAIFKGPYHPLTPLIR